MALVVAVAALVAAGACGGAGRPGEMETEAELSIARPVSRGVLSYAVAFTGGPKPRLVSIELGAAFDLVVRSLDRASGALVERRRIALGPPDWDVSDLAVVPGGRRALVASAAGTVRVLDLEDGRAVQAWHLGAAATAVAVSPDGRLVATGSASGVVCLRRLADGALLQCLVAHRAAVSGLDFDPRGDRLASSSWDGRVGVWSVPPLAALAALETGGSANRVAFAPDGGLLAVAVSRAPPRRTPEIEASERRAPPTGAPDPGGRVLLWRGSRGERARELRGHGGPVTTVAWSRGGERVLSASWDRTVRLWDARTGRERVRLSGFSHLVRGLAVDEGGGWIAASGWAAGGDDPATVLLALRHPP